MKTTRKLFFFVSFMLASLVFFSQALIVNADEDEIRIVESAEAFDDRQSLGSVSKKRDRNKIIRGYAVTGHNDILGEPFFDWGPPFGTFGFFTMGIYNEFGAEPIHLNPDIDPSALVSTALDPNLLASTGITPEEVNPDWVNIPLRDVPVQYSYGKSKVFPEISLADPGEKGQAGPVDPITLGQWMEATGVGKVTCFDDGSARVRLRMKHLIPNRLYAVWATMGPSASGEGEVFPSIPIGGTPNLFITDDKGYALYDRKMQFCPIAPDTTDRNMLVINVQYHSNHQNYGGINGPPLPQVELGYWIGTVIHNHLQFPINVTLIDDDS